MRGVYWNKQTGKWRAALSRQYLGEFSDESSANQARKAAEIRMFGRAFEEPAPIVVFDVTLIPIYRRGGVVVGWTAIDTADLELVEATRWSLSKTGYVVGRPDDRVVKMHRHILKPSPQHVIDHADGNPLNNTRSNLRVCFQRQNCRNSRKTAGRVIPYKGVSKKDGRYRARIMLNRREIALGMFSTQEEAARAYDEAAKTYFGEFARLNFPEEKEDARP